MIDDDMRNFIVLAESLNVGSIDISQDTPASIEPETAAASPVILHDLGELVARLRSFMETESGEYALGVEMGMQRAADMIENLVRRYKEGGPLE